MKGVGIIPDMICHRRYVLDNLFGPALGGPMHCWTRHRTNRSKPVWSPDQLQTIDFFEGSTQPS
ncbi:MULTISPECIES: hypothetical protein [Rhizobium]|uniref:hypothetical protein n=1 Tax=Rhizobium TaxID=379 RepID=UPI001956AC47|nr:MULTISPECIES: hypothetical protein [Rhizobium]MBM7048746.1 hypothetical protein [Rhizobium lusitanum]